jgi:hypothetical protein
MDLFVARLFIRTYRTKAPAPPAAPLALSSPAFRHLWTTSLRPHIAVLRVCLECPVSPSRSACGQVSLGCPAVFTSSVPTFTELCIPHGHEVVSAYAYEIILPNRAQLRLRQSFDAEAVSALVSVLGALC